MNLDKIRNAISFVLIFWLGWDAAVRYSHEQLFTLTIDVALASTVAIILWLKLNKRWM